MVFFGHDARAPGTFFIDPVVEKQALVASLWLPTRLRLLDLTGDMAFRTSIHVRLSSPDHERCQWFARRLHGHGVFEGTKAFDGLLYPSRTDRSKAAIAVHSRCVERFRAGIRSLTIRFEASAQHAQLVASQHRWAAPAKWV